MALKVALTWLCWLAALSSSAAEALPTDCSSHAQRFLNLSAELRGAVECGDELLSAWSAQQRAALLLSLRNLTDSLHRLQLNDANKCPAAEVPANGGLVCVTVALKHYCKPLCNHGYDFDFLRRSRLYEECSERTQHRWTTQYVGGNRLAVCNEASVQVSGAKSAYFPTGQDCQTTKRSDKLQEGVTETFITELKAQGIRGQKEDPRLLCQ